MSRILTTTEFISLTKDMKPTNENGVCAISIDKNNVELIYSFDLEAGEYYLEAFGKYKEVSFGEFETVEEYDLTIEQEGALQNKIMAVVGTQYDQDEIEYLVERTEYRRDEVDGYMYAV